MKLAKRALNVSPSLTLEITAKAKKMKADGLNVVSFGAGEPDFNTPQYIIDAAKVALDKGMTKYTPSSGTLELRKAVVKKFKDDNNLEYAPGQIVVSNGAKHSLYNALQAIVDPGDEVIIPAPYWLTYPELVKLCDGVCVFVETKQKNDFKLTAGELEQAITPKTKAIIINNPNNPTGAVYTKDELYALAKTIEKHPDMFIIADEIYEKLCYGENTVSIASFSQQIKDRTVVVNGVSKTYSMTGWRIGYTASNLALAKAMDSMQSHTTSNANSIAQYASCEAIGGSEGEAFMSLMRSTFDRRRKLIMEKLDHEKTLSYITPSGAFYVMVNVSGTFGKSIEEKTINSAADFADLILEHELVAVIPCESFGADAFIRLSYAISDADIALGVDRMIEFVRKLK